MIKNFCSMTDRPPDQVNHTQDAHRNRKSLHTKIQSSILNRSLDIYICPIALRTDGLKWTKWNIEKLCWYTIMKIIIFVSLDIEGGEFQVLQTIPWDKVIYFIFITD